METKPEKGGYIIYCAPDNVNMFAIIKKVFKNGNIKVHFLLHLKPMIITLDNDTTVVDPEKAKTFLEESSKDYRKKAAVLVKRASQMEKIVKTILIKNENS